MSFINSTFSSDLILEAVKNQRANMCAKVLDLAEFSSGSSCRFCFTVFDAI
jgi:hypothetical protein